MPNKQNKLKSFYDNFIDTAKKVKTLPQDAIKANQLMQKRRNANNDAYNRLIKGK